MEYVIRHMMTLMIFQRSCQRWFWLLRLHRDQLARLRWDQCSSWAWRSLPNPGENSTECICICKCICICIWICILLVFFPLSPNFVSAVWSIPSRRILLAFPHLWLSQHHPNSPNLHPPAPAPALDFFIPLKFNKFARLYILHIKRLGESGWHIY